MTDTKIINSRCICKKGLPWINLKVVMILPCEHLIHQECLNKDIKNNKYICPICSKKIFKIIDHKYYRHDHKYFQQCIDILSVTNFDNSTSINMIEVTKNLPLFLNILCNIPLDSGIQHGENICSKIFNMNNIKINVYGFNKLKNITKKVYISNHTCYLDFIILFYILKTGFVSSSAILDNVISKNLLNIIQCMIIKRGNTKNTVQQMKDYVDKHNSICLFPEGMMTNPNTLIEFRTGAFYIGYPIIPIVIKYKNVISAMDISNFILKIASYQIEEVDVFILDPYYPPFDHKKIRLEMAKTGNLLLSRVSNRDLHD